MDYLERFFKLNENKTTVKTEITAGITTFMTMAYILIVNPLILGDTGMDKGALLTATALSSAIATLVMAFVANYPFALAPGMGLNAFFAYTVVIKMGYSWQTALTAVFIEGILFIILSLFSVREAIFDSIPKNLKLAVSVGIGFFITFIGLKNAEIIIVEGDLLALGEVKNIPVLLALLGIIFTVFLVVKRVRGSLLWGILATYVLGVIFQLIGIYHVDPSVGMYSLIPERLFSPPPSLSPILFKFDFSNVLSFDFLVVIFSFLFVDVFDTLGTLIGVSSKSGFLDKEGKLPRIKGALLADAVGTVSGACLGTSTVTTYVESAAGVTDGGRTGLTAFTTAILFIIALIFTPVISVIPTFATAPALVAVGLFMIESVTKIDFSDYTEGFPAFATIIMMPLTYSISDGLIFGVLSFVALKLFTKRTKDLNTVITIVAAAFLIKLIVS